MYKPFILLTIIDQKISPKKLDYTSHLIKLFLKVNRKRTYKVCGKQIAPVQVPFRNTFAQRRYLWYTELKGPKTHICMFINHKKAFDQVRHVDIKQKSHFRAYYKQANLKSW